MINTLACVATPHSLVKSAIHVCIYTQSALTRIRFICSFVGSCLATKVLFAGYGNGLGDHKVGQ